MNGQCVPTIASQTLDYITLLPCLLVILVLYGYMYCSKSTMVFQVPFLSLVDNDRNRTMIVLAFGFLVNSIFELLEKEAITAKVSSSFVQIITTVVMFFIIVIIKAITIYPIFACISSTANQCVVSLLGCFYIFWQIVALLLKCTYLTCYGGTQSRDETIAIELVKNMPGFCCLFTLLYQFSKRYYKAYKQTSQRNLTKKTSVVNTAQLRHVKKVFYSSRYVSENGESLPWYLKLRQIIHSLFFGKNFKFSTILLSTMFIIVLAYYQIAVLLIRIIIIFRSGFSNNDNFVRFYDSMMAFSFIGTIVTYTCIIIHFFYSHQRTMSYLFKGKRNRTIKEMSRISSIKHVRSNLKFSGFLVAHMIWGLILLLFSMMVICFVFWVLLTMVEIEFIVIQLIKYVLAVASMPTLLYVVQILLVRFVFTTRTEKSEPGSILTMRHAKLYHVEMYFSFFFNVISGLASSFKRSLVSFIISLLFMGRLDRTSYVFFTQFDSGYQAYLGFLYMQKIYKNPSMRCFCQILLDSVAVSSDKKNTTLCNGERDFNEQKPKAASQQKDNKVARNRWFLAVTIINNPLLRDLRRSDTENHSTGPIENLL